MFSICLLATIFLGNLVVQKYMPPTPFTNMAITFIFLENPYFNRAFYFDQIFKTFTTARNIFQQLKSFVALKFEIRRAVFISHIFSVLVQMVSKNKSILLLLILFVHFTLQ